jgi:hypothetical protein
MGFRDQLTEGNPLPPDLARLREKIRKIEGCGVSGRFSGRVRERNRNLTTPLF